MIINELKEKQCATVTLRYDEIHLMANIVYNACRDKPEYQEVRNKWNFLRDVVGYGMIKPQTVQGMWKCLQDKIEDDE